MSQNLVTLEVSGEQLAAAHAALSPLESAAGRLVLCGVGGAVCCAVLVRQSKKLGRQSSQLGCSG